MNDVSERSAKQALRDMRNAERDAAREYESLRKHEYKVESEKMRADHDRIYVEVNSLRKQLAEAFKANNWQKGEIITIGWRRNRLALYVGVQFGDQLRTYIDHKGRLYVQEKRKSKKHERCLLIIYGTSQLCVVRDMLARVLASYPIPE